MARSGLVAIIPAFNEANTIAAVINQTCEYADVLIVDDGSTDETSQQALTCGAIVVVHPQNRGYDAALNTGFAEAKRLGYKVALTMDADGQHNPQEVELFIKAIEGGADIVVGNRQYRQRLGEHFFSFVTKFRHGIHDPVCGMKAYKMSTYNALGHFDSYGSIGTELMLHAVRAGSKVEQVQIKVRERDDQPRFGRTIDANWRLLKAALHAF